MLEYHEGFRDALEQTPQDPIWHGEGNVWKHTELVRGALETLPEYQEADKTTRWLLDMAAALHDIGKLSVSRQENGRWVASGHGKVGAQMARTLLWQEYSLCGTKETQQLREGICGLIRYHSLPTHAIDEDDGKLRLLRFAANGNLVPGLTVKNLCTLAKADILGRICPDQQELLDKVVLCEELAKEAGCFEGPYPFPSEHTQFHHLAGKNVPMAYSIYNDTWGEVVLMSGLPGTGKDTWLRENCPELPMISLDELRKELGISPLENQSRVLDAAREQAKTFLRRHQRFVWNATNLSATVRGRQLQLFTAYGASVRIVYLETGWEEQLRRNQSRTEAVPEHAICHMLENLSPPERFEAHKVEWHLV